MNVHDQNAARRQVNNRPSTKDKPFNNPLQIQLNDVTRRRVAMEDNVQTLLPSDLPSEKQRAYEFINDSSRFFIL